MRTSGLNIQSAAARRSAEARLRTLVAEIAPDHQRLTAALRRWLRKRLPAAYELVYEYANCIVISFSSDERGYEGVLAIRTSAGAVKLYFNRGKGLPDPEKLLRGSAKLVRWIAMEDVAILKRPAVVDLIDEAIARNRVPFVSRGIGPVVIRSDRGKPRRKRRPVQDRVD